MNAKQSPWIFSAILLVVAAALPASAQHSAASANLWPTEISLGEAARLEIQVDGLSNSPRIVSTEALKVTPAGRTQMFSSTNGMASQSTTYLYRVIPTRPGNHQLSNVTVATEAGVATLPIPTLRVSAGPPSRGARNSAVPGGQMSAPQPEQRSSALESPKGPRAFIRLELDEEAAYVGQSITGRVKLYVDAYTAGAVEGPVEIQADDLLIEGLDQEPSQTRTEIGGRLYNLLTWDVSVRSIREGEHQLEATAPVELRWEELTREAPDASSGRDSLLASSLFDDPFFSGRMGGGGASRINAMLDALSRGGGAFGSGAMG